jgi:hypothetical protein
LRSTSYVYAHEKFAILSSCRVRNTPTAIDKTLGTSRPYEPRTPKARELLAPVYGRFNKGFDMRDLKEAKALLENLPPKKHQVISSAP